VAASYGAILTK